MAVGHVTAAPAPTSETPAAVSAAPIGGPVSVAWREGTLTRAEELEALSS